MGNGIIPLNKQLKEVGVVMAKTRSSLDTRETFVYDRSALEEKFRKLGVSEKLTEILESHVVFDYFEKNLVMKVSKWAKSFATDEAREYFCRVIARENLMMNVRANVENNLLMNAMEFWFKLDAPFEEIVDKLLTPTFVMKTIDILAKEIENLEYDIKSREYEGFKFSKGNDDDNNGYLN